MKHLGIVTEDPWLEPVEQKLIERHESYLSILGKITSTAGSIVDYANGYRWFGWQWDDSMDGWWFREWLPEAIDVFIFGDFNSWQRTEIRLDRDANGVWSAFFPRSMYEGKLTKGSMYKIHVHGKNGWRDRIPAYATRVVQDETTKNFTAQFYPIEEYDWKNPVYTRNANDPLLIYEAHVGMAVEREGVGTYAEFERDVLPRIRRDGYTAVQIMAIAEHPYYGSFGYHVSSFFAPSSRFGTPEELKHLIDTAHGMGLAVIMDLVHAHYVANENEGIADLDGSDHLYSEPGEHGIQKYWGSKTFDYSKEEVRHFLLSNIKYWMEVYHMDGFRMDGVTSMLYHHHGYTEFDSREKYFNDEVNLDAIRYLTLANTLIHEFRPAAITIAEDVSGMPGMCRKTEEGGIGFDYRLAMAIPDYWIRILEDEHDEQWSVGEMWETLSTRLPNVGTIAYCESHDQALVGDKTIAFRLMGSLMYDQMDASSKSQVLDRGMALHEMIRLATITIGGDAYLNFMGNEFGHPEWIDFPREGNGWSYAHARRQWSLSDNGFLRYRFLEKFDNAMIRVVREYGVLSDGYAYLWQTDERNKTLGYSHKGLYFILNFDPVASIPSYRIEVPWPGKYTPILSTDDTEYGGLGRLDLTVSSFSSTEKDGKGHEHYYILVYNTSRTGTVFRFEH